MNAILSVSHPFFIKRFPKKTCTIFKESKTISQEELRRQLYEIIRRTLNLDNIFYKKKNQKINQYTNEDLRLSQTRRKVF